MSIITRDYCFCGEYPKMIRPPHNEVGIELLGMECVCGANCVVSFIIDEHHSIPTKISHLNECWNDMIRKRLLDERYTKCHRRNGKGNIAQ